MKKLQCSLAAKLCAWVLAAAALAGASVTGMLVLFGGSCGLYENRKPDYFNSSMVYSAAYSFAEFEVGNRTRDGDYTELESYSSGDSCNFLYRLETEDGRVLSATMESGSDVAAVYDFFISGPSMDDAEWQSYRVTVAVKEDLPNRNDGLFDGYRLFRSLESHADGLLILLAGFGLGFLLLLTFLAASAGHKIRDGRPVVAPGGLDRIPFDVYTAALAIAFGLLLTVAVEWNVSGSALRLGLAVALPAGLLTAAGLVLTAWIVSFAARVKLGKWWRNTVIYRVLRVAWRLLRRAGRGLRDVCRAVPIVWKLLVVTAGLLVLLFILGLLSYENGAMLLLDFLLCLAILAAVGLAGLQLRTLQKGGEALAAGDLDARVDTSRMFWDFKRHGENLNAIGDGMAIAVEQRLRSERLKTELITNVSHDIKTPLTSILNYVDLLQHAETEEQKQQYLEVLQRQAVRLKKLTEDLVEASKASTGNVTVTLVPTNAVESVNQALGEYAERLAAGNLTPVTDFPEGGVTIRADGRLLWRVLDNLLNNICKYALAGTRVYVTVAAEEREVVLTLKNISRQQLNISADELMERFVRGDASRTTEGSGLGLNIARSLTELQKGTLRLEVDGDLFKVELRFPKV